MNNILQLPEGLNTDEKVRLFNELSQALFDWLDIPHPTLNVQLVPVDSVVGNDYNPNKVAPPEMQLLKTSIRKDGMTMPVVVSSEQKNDNWEVVDGFHRTTVCKHDTVIRESLLGYLPVTKLNKSVQERVTSTVRHNMARGTHQVELTSKLVVFLKKHNWSDARIGKEIGMDADEVLRMKQISGLTEAFKNEEFSKSWI